LLLGFGHKDATQGEPPKPGQKLIESGKNLMIEKALDGSSRQNENA
jgi:hypothetical protein